MSKRNQVATGCHACTVAITGAVLSLLCVLVAAPPLAAQGQTTVRIPWTDNVGLDQNLTLPIMLDSIAVDYQFAGFDLLIGFDAGLLTLTGASLGETGAACDWEYFTYRMDTTACGPDCPSGLVRTVAVADINNGARRPSCFLSESGALLTLSFHVSGSPSALGAFAPIEFFWRDCGDNAFANPTGDSLYVSHRVISATPEGGYDEITDGATGFPTWTGVQTECFGQAPKPLIGAVDFYNGGVRITDPDTTVPHARVRVDYEEASPGGNVYVGVHLDSTSDDFNMWGFDFLIGYDSLLISPWNVQQGALLDSCEWEYFSFRYGPASGCDASCPTGILRFVGISDVNDGAHHPACYGEDGGELARVLFHVTDDPGRACELAYIRFLWVDCGDNVFSSFDGNRLMMANRVYDHPFTGNSEDITQNDAFPTIHGAPDECIDTSAVSRTFRGIDFYNGAIGILCDSSPTPGSGDINLNGMPYEIADAVVFSNYFVKGLAAFWINIEEQIAQTDINRDGLVLSLDDLTYLIRIIVGDALPLTKQMTSGMIDTVHVYCDSGSVSLTLDENITALHLVFQGETGEIASSLPSGLTLEYEYDSSVTRVLISPQTSSSGSLYALGEGALFGFTGDAQLISAEASRDGLTRVVAVINGVQQGACCLARGNVDHGADGVVNIVDVTRWIGYAFGGLPAPVCLVEADVDGNGQINIVDLTALIGYLYRGGQPPAPCP